MKELLTIEKIDEITLQQLKEDPVKGVTEYPILDFDKRALRKLSKGVHETLRYSKIKPNRKKSYLKMKRAFDVCASSFGLLLCGIPILVFALLIFLQDGGNPFFTQDRLTEDGKIFKMIKLRSMCKDAEKQFKKVQAENQTDGLAFKADDDPRITPLGKFIRKTSIDELPQLWNVLQGDMSIIGPRPPLPREVVLYTPYQMQKFLVKGGLACIAQADGRSDLGFDEWVKSDIEYVKTQSFMGDIKLCFRIFWAVITRKGAK